jgi:hypothetical protein
LVGLEFGLAEAANIRKNKYGKLRNSKYYSEDKRAEGVVAKFHSEMCCGESFLKDILRQNLVDVESHVAR